MIELCGLDANALEEYVRGLGESAFRAKQIRRWVCSGAEIAQMTNLSKSLRERLALEAVANPVSIERAFVSQVDGTEKYLYRLPDGNRIEGVAMRYAYGRSLCLSTQVGCKMGCAFCASTIDGCVRDCTVGELVGQVLSANNRLRETDANARIHNLVLMGSGEPFDNYENVVAFLRAITDPDGLNMSLRAISVSTCGIVPKMYKFAEEGLPVTLCLSLHAPNDAIRRTLMPIARTYTIEETLDACRNYVKKTGRRVVFEYALVGGVNDGVECARELAGRLRGLQCHVNLIPLNTVEESALKAPTSASVQAFLDTLTRLRISATRRREMGDDIAGACGQLRRSVAKTHTEE